MRCYFRFFERVPPRASRAVKLAIPFLALLSVMMLPLDLEQGIKATLGVFVCVALLWTLEPVPLAVTALLVPVLLVLLGIATPFESLQPFADPIVFLLMGGLIIAEAFRVNGLDRRLAFFLVSRLGGDINRALLALMLVTALLSMWMSNTATIALLLPVSAGIASKVTQDRTKVLSIFLIGMGMAGLFGGMMTVTGSPPNAITAALLGQQTPFSFLDWMIVGVPIGALLFGLAFFLLPRLMRLKGQSINIEQVREDLRRMGRLSRGESRTLIIFFPTVFLWMFGSDLGSLLPVSSGFFSAAIVALFAAFLMFAARALDWSDAKRISWEVFLIVGAGLAVGEALEATGTASYIADLVASHLGGLNIIVVMLIIGCLSVAFTNLISNTASAAMLVPIALGLASSLGVDAKYLVLTVGFCVSLAIITPIGTPALTLIYSTGNVSRKDLARTGIVISAISIPLIVGLVYSMVTLGLV